MRKGAHSPESLGKTYALVFAGCGGRANARLIQKALEAEGFETERWGNAQDSLPSPGEAEGLDRVRARLLEFRQDHPDDYCCVHPGTTAWAERPELVQIAQEIGLPCITPSARHVNLFRNKLAFLATADLVSIPHLVLDPDPLHSVREVRTMATQTGSRFPIILKSARGSGGLGHFVGFSFEDIDKSLPLFLEQMQRGLGECIVYSERYLEGARQVVVPFVRLADGHFQCFPMVDVSLQLRTHKIVEQCPAFRAPTSIEPQLTKWTEAFAEQCEFVGVGALEFLIDGNRPFLIDGVARLSTGFHLWERIAGTSAVAWQLAAMSERGEMPRKPSPGPAAGICARIYAEDPVLQLPHPGTVHELSEQREWRLGGCQAELVLDPEIPGSISSNADSLLGMLFVTGPSPAKAMTLAQGVLSEMWIAGSLQTNERFLSELLAHHWVAEGMTHAGFIDEEFIPSTRPPEELFPLFAATCLFASPSAESCRWMVGDQWARTEGQQLSWVGEARRFEVKGMPGISGCLKTAGGREVRLCAYPVVQNRWQVRIGEWVLPVKRVKQMAPGTKARSLLSLVQGQVHSILFQPGALVPAHEPIVIVDSLRTLVPHALPLPVRMLEWKTTADSPVEAGQELALFEIVRAPEN